MATLSGKSVYSGDARELDNAAWTWALIGGQTYRLSVAQIAAAMASTNRNFATDAALEEWGNGGTSGAETMTDGGYDALDNWYSLIQGGSDATIERIAGTDGSQYTAKMVAGGTTNRFGIAQSIPFSITAAMQDQPVTFQARVRSNMNSGAGNNMDLRAAILAWTGTADNPTLDVVDDWTDGTFTTGNFFKSTTLADVAVSSSAVQAEHDTWTDISVTGTVDTNATNLMLVIWTEDVPAHANDFLEVGKLGLFFGSEKKFWAPPFVASSITQAAQSAIESETNEDTYVPPDLLKYAPGVAKARGNVDMTSTAVLYSGNGVDSVSDAGTGILGVTLSNAMDSTTYVLNAISGQRETQALIASTTAFTIYTRSSAGTATDAADICFTVYGEFA